METAALRDSSVARGNLPRALSFLRGILALPLTADAGVGKPFPSDDPDIFSL